MVYVYTTKSSSRIEFFFVWKAAIKYFKFLIMDELEFSVRLHVVRERDTLFTVELGTDVIQQATMVVDEEGVYFRASGGFLREPSLFRMSWN